MVISVPSQTTEDDRLALQAHLDEGKTASERNALGQFATPTQLAREILTYARQSLPAEVPIRFLDPALGTGSFYSALLAEFPSERVTQALGFEIDPYYGEPARCLWADSGLEMRIADFTRAKPADGDRVNLLICNPPYVRHHHIAAADKHRLAVITRLASGMKLSGLAGLYSYFLGLAHPWMAEGALAGWLIPSEFMDVNYGREVKRYLLERVSLRHIHRFDPQDAQFDDALVSSAVIWFTNERPKGDHDITVSYGGSLLQPNASTTLRRSQLAEMAKWTRVCKPASRPFVDGSRRPRVGDLFEIRRGIATGANNFFVLTAEQIEQQNLPRELFRPILPAPRYLKVNEVLTDDDGLPRLEQQLFLLDCALPERNIEVTYPALWRYLQRGIANGVSDGYLARHRSPWYTQERRPAAPLLCTYMGRQNTRAGKPFRFILNHSQATAANVYLMLYPKPTLAALVRGEPSLLRSIWEQLNALDNDQLIAEGRVYGGGLHKLEPRELANVRLEIDLERLAPLLMRWQQPTLV